MGKGVDPKGSGVSAIVHVGAPPVSHVVRRERTHLSRSRGPPGRPPAPPFGRDALSGLGVGAVLAAQPRAARQIKSY